MVKTNKVFDYMCGPDYCQCFEMQPILSTLSLVADSDSDWLI